MPSNPTQTQTLGTSENSQNRTTAGSLTPIFSFEMSPTDAVPDVDATNQPSQQPPEARASAVVEPETALISERIFQPAQAFADANAISSGADLWLLQDRAGNPTAGPNDVLAPDVPLQAAARFEWVPDLTIYETLQHEGACGCSGCAMKLEELTQVAAESTTSEGGSSSTSSAAALMGDMADFLLTGYWNTGYGDGTRSHNVTSTGIDANNGVLHYNLSGYSADADGLTADRAFLVREAFKLFEATLGIQFVETTSTDTNLVDFFFRDNDSGAYAGSSYYNSGQWGSTIHYAQINVAQSWSGGTSTYDDYTLQTILHEIGHAIGLGHQGPYNGSATYGVSNVFENDSWQASMMSYFSQTENTSINASYEFLQTPMAVDWMALDVIYGRQGYGVSNAFTEDTVWGFNTTVTSEVSDIWAQWSSYANRTASTLVDGGGIDTLDLSGYSNNTLINLAPSDRGATSPSLSDIGGRIGNLAIAEGTIIENAIGGAGAEVFYGNVADNTFTGNGGDDTFYDSAGSDTYYGDAGTDQVIFGATFASYTIEVISGVLRVIDTAIDWVADTVEWLAFADQTLSWQAVADTAGTANTPPVAANDGYSVTEGELLSATSLLTNDTDADGGILSITNVNGQATGTTIALASGALVAVQADGSFDYDQNGAFDSLNTGEQATDGFTYTISDGQGGTDTADVTIIIEGVTQNSAPVAANDAFSVTEGAVLSATDLLANDSDADGGILRVTSVNGQATGTAISLASGALVTVQADGSFDYDQNGAFNSLNAGEQAIDGFSYTVADGQGGTDTADVTITIDGVSPETVTSAMVLDFEGVAVGAYAGTADLHFEGLDVVNVSSLGGFQAGQSAGQVIITTKGNDFDLDALSSIVASGRTKIIIEAFDDGVLVGTTQLNVSARRPTDAVFDSTFDSIDRVVLTGDSAFLLDDIAVLTRSIVDPGGNTPPVAQDDSFTTSETSVVTGNLLSDNGNGADSDPDGDTLDVISVAGADTGPVALVSGAIVTFAADGSFSYDPNGAFDALYDGQTATDSFVYEISDGQGGVDMATATVTIAGSGAAPTRVVLDFETGLQEDGFSVIGAILAGVGTSDQSAQSLGDGLSITRNGSTFDFDGAIVTVFGKGRVDATFTGYVNGEVVATEIVSLRTGKEEAVTLSNPDFDIIDEISILAVGGVTVDDIAFWV